MFHFETKSLVRWFLFFMAWPLMGCVGPSTPFGSMDEWWPDFGDPDEMVAHQISQPEQANKEDLNLARIHFYPDRQKLHEQTNFKVIIDDPQSIPDKATVRVYYNGHNVSRTFHQFVTMTINQERTRLVMNFPDLVLLAHKDHDIRFVYDRGEGRIQVATNYTPPHCDWVAKSNVRHTGPFDPPDSYVRSVGYWSLKYDFNPALTAGLIAQESSFNPKAVSWAKAVGLTQVTNLADQDVAQTHKSWPRSTAIRKYPAPIVKTMIATGQITARDDWRLDPERSIQGGLTYMNHLRDYWKTQHNYKFLEKHFSEPEMALSDVVLASYNSGAARVKKALSRRGMDYLRDPSLKEARKYVRKVNSYCYHFSKGT